MSSKVYDDKGMIKVFVYGTLKRGHGNHRLLVNSKSLFVGRDTISGPFSMCDMGGFPGVYRHGNINSLSAVKGEIWATNQEGLAALDLLEGHPRFYQRQKLETNEHKKKAWIYVLNPKWLAQVPELREDKRNISDLLWMPDDEEESFWKVG